MTDITARLRLIREAVGDTQRKMSKRMGLGVNGWQNYELGVSAPSLEVLDQLRVLGFSVEWVITGEGAMRPGEQAQPPAAPPPLARAKAQLDEALMQRIAAEIDRVYREENARIPPLLLVQLAARVYSDLVTVCETEEEIALGLKLQLQQLRRELRTPTSGADTKRQA